MSFEEDNDHDSRRVAKVDRGQHKKEALPQLPARGGILSLPRNDPEQKEEE